MKTKYYRFVILGILLLSIGSFIFLNTCGVASTVSADIMENSSLQLPDAKMTKLILQHFLEFIKH